MRLLKFFYFLLFPMLLAYPNGLFVDTYVNYYYVLFVFLSFILFDTNHSFKLVLANKFFLSLWGIVLIANIWSLIFSYEISLFNYLSSTLRYLSYFLIASVIVSTTKTGKDFRFWVNSFLTGFTLSLIVLFLDAYRIPWIDSTFKIVSFADLNTLDIYYRAYGSYLSPISAGVFVLNAFLLIISLLVTNNNLPKSNKLFLGILAIFSTVAIVMTASRTTMVAFGASILFLILFSKHKFKFLIILLFLSVIVYQTGILDHYFENILLRNENQDIFRVGILQGSGRIETLIHSLNLYFDYRTTLFGVGPTEYSIGDGSYSYAHNGFVSLFLCYGFLGFILFLTTGIDIYKRIIKRELALHKRDNNKFLNLYSFLFFSINMIAFISSDGPVSHFWLIFFLFFLFFVEKYGSFVYKGASPFK